LQFRDCGSCAIDVRSGELDAELGDFALERCCSATISALLLAQLIDMLPRTRQRLLCFGRLGTSGADRGRTLARHVRDLRANINEIALATLACFRGRSKGVLPTGRRELR
jgi:hypothetical protein